jgi:3-hydroxy-9,10-secoandrosta-1,3,5(10)-triene-9,17-dione monooxygenase reductase component
MTDTEIERRVLRDALGQFATGVTVVTTLTGAGEKVGLTVNSFTSLSLDPPLVLWNLSRHSAKFEAFDNTDYFAVNVLGADQESLALAFARPGGTPFNSLQTEAGAGGVPLLPGCLAYFECRMTHRYPGGDHDMLIGEVLNFRDIGGEPLLFYRGRFGRFAS